MEYSISKDIIFSKLNKTYSLEDNCFTKTKQTPWVYGKTEYDSYNIKELFKLYDIELDFQIPQKFKNCINQLNLKDNGVIWEYILPDTIYEELVSEFAESISINFKQLDTDYYTNTLL